MDFRLGDVIDDYCIKCRRMTNHSVVSLMDGQVAKVRCRSCYHEHTYLHEQAPPSRKDLKKAEMLAMASSGGAAEAPAAEKDESAERPAAPESTPANHGPAAPVDSKTSRPRGRKGA